MTRITGVAEATLYVDDLDRATEFYTSVLGLLLTDSSDRARFLQTGRDSTLILFNAEAIRQRTSPIPKHGSVGEGHVAFSVPVNELDDWRERLERLGVEIEHEQTWSLGSRSIYFRDPDNNSLELISEDHYPLTWQRHVSPNAGG
jgi:catechol 2,3-dioxygenase-like lactoylglutathione lyase family enzyme